MSLSRAVAHGQPLADAAMPFDRALRVALDLVASMPALPVRSAALGTCHDRVLAERIRVEHDLPLRDVAAVDGYALSRRACRGAGPWRLRLTGRIAAARVPASGTAFPNREAVRITAGAPVPPSLDTVIPTHAAQRAGEYITLTHPPAEEGTIRARGAEAKCGNAIAEPDRLLDARNIAVLAAAGHTAVKVRRTLRVGVLSIGNSRQEKTGAASRAMLLAALDRRWIGCHDLGTVTGSTMARTLRKMPGEVDIALAIDRGGVAEAIEEAGGHIVLDGIGMQPGGSVRLAQLDGMALLLLPAEPVAALTAMAILGWPLLRRRAGIQHSRSVPRAGIAAFSLDAPTDQARYPLIRVAGAGEVPTLEAMEDRPGSDDEGSLARLARADGIALLTPGSSTRFGNRVAWVPLSGRYE